MNPTELSTMILSIVGICLQILFKYVPVAADWYQKQANKGLLMLGFVVVTAGVLFALSCTPYAAQLGISLACTSTTLFDLLRAVFIVASSQQLAYLYSRGTSG
jgi:hypothetical protein